MTPSRLGQAYLSPRGNLILVVSDPWVHPWVSETDLRHDVAAFPTEERFHVGESDLAALESEDGWVRLA